MPAGATWTRSILDRHQTLVQTSVVETDNVPSQKNPDFAGKSFTAQRERALVSATRAPVGCSGCVISLSISDQNSKALLQFFLFGGLLARCLDLIREFELGTGREVLHVVGQVVRRGQSLPADSRLTTGRRALEAMAATSVNRIPGRPSIVFTDLTFVRQ